MRILIFKVTFFSIIIFSLISCEANKHISVTVFDSISKKPLDSVFVKVKAGKNGDYHKSYREGFTDTNGKFDTYMMIGCAFGCYDIYMEYTKNGYTEKIDFNVTEGNVYLNPK